MVNYLNAKLITIVTVTLLERFYLIPIIIIVLVLSAVRCNSRVAGVGGQLKVSLPLVLGLVTAEPD